MIGASGRSTIVPGAISVNIAGVMTGAGSMTGTVGSTDGSVAGTVSSTVGSVAGTDSSTDGSVAGTDWSAGDRVSSLDLTTTMPAITAAAPTRAAALTTHRRRRRSGPRHLLRDKVDHDRLGRSGVTLRGLAAIEDRSDALPQGVAVLRIGVVMRSITRRSRSSCIGRS